MTAPSEITRAVRAAQAVARAHGVACDDAAVVGAGSNVMVHLRPAPVVARVMTGTAFLHQDVERWLTREVAVGRFLGARGLAVPPSDLLPPGPFRHDGHDMTFWAFVRHEPPGALPAPAELGASLRELHEALAGFPGELGPLTDIRDWLDRLLLALEPTPERDGDAIERLRTRLDGLTASVFAAPLPTQPIHGDASTANRLRTPSGHLWNDLEDACVGPVHWDLGGLVVEARLRGADEAHVRALLRAYDGPGLDELQPFLEAHALYMTIWSALSAQRRAR